MCFCDKLTVPFVLGGDFNLLPSFDVQEEVGCLLSCEMTKIHVVDLKREAVRCDQCVCGSSEDDGEPCLAAVCGLSFSLA